MGVRTYLEEALADIPYSSLGEWILPNIDGYSIGKKLFDYQARAIESAIKALYLYYSDPENGKKTLLNACIGAGFTRNSLDIKESVAKKTNDNRFDLYAAKYNVVVRGGEKTIDEIVFFNRVCFWMATASGKTFVLIKMIEVLDALVKKELIPQKDILVLLPNEKLQGQFFSAVREYNIGKTRKISVKSLKYYEEAKNSFDSDLTDEIPVFVYRSDLLSDSEKTKKIDIETYDNNGEWYIFLDEAHKGDKDEAQSLRQAYVTIMSRNGFLFNFSASFTDNIDYTTSCFNFNLEKFIEAKYGKNIYLSDSNFNFDKKSDELSESEKQFQVLKSLIVFTLVKKSKKRDFYHAPLAVTLVNEVNTQNSDTDMFFAELGKIATGKIDKELFARAKQELINEFNEKPTFMFGTERLYADGNELADAIETISISDILSNAFNASTHGKIEIAEGEKGKEFVLKLATAEKPFALFRIGDATKYIKEKLVGDYRLIDSYTEKHYFDGLNGENGSCINMLIGSRMFYEGWDSNRPNVMNFINIGKGDSKKFVLQSLGRGVRIQPDPSDPQNRQRLSVNNSNKNRLLETLFVFATNRAAVNTVLQTLETQRTNEVTLSLEKNKRPFDLLIPRYCDKGRVQNSAKFRISRDSFVKLRSYVGFMSDELLLLFANICKEDISKLRASFDDPSSLFVFDKSRDYKDIKGLLGRISTHLALNDKSVYGFDELGEDDIIHFDHIKISRTQWDIDGKDIVGFINDKSIGSGEDEAELQKLYNDKKISKSEFIKRLTATESKTYAKIGMLNLYKLVNHFYSPCIVAETDKIDNVKHIITVPGERDFIKNLVDHINSSGEFTREWMFSKIDQTMDSKNVAMPYYDPNDNAFHFFYPDFIFWQKKGNEYRITFVDPKGTKHTDYEFKVDYFKTLFMQNGKPRVFKHKSYDITFALRLTTNDKSLVPKGYSDFWFGNDDFSWLD